MYTQWKLSFSVFRNSSGVHAILTNDREDTLGYNKWNIEMKYTLSRYSLSVEKIC